MIWDFSRFFGLIGGMGCFPCFDTREEEGLNLAKERDDRSDRKVALATANSNISRLSSGADRLRTRSAVGGSRRESSGPKDMPDVNIAAQTFTFRELAATTKNFREECLLGEGGFGRVYKGRLESTGQIVAVKQLDRDGLQGNREFLVEVLMLSLLHHPNLVNLIGYCADGDQRLLVYEFMPLGSLEDHLHVDPNIVPGDLTKCGHILFGEGKMGQWLGNVASFSPSKAVPIPLRFSSKQPHHQSREVQSQLRLHPLEDRYWDLICSLAKMSNLPTFVTHQLKKVSRWLVAWTVNLVAVETVGLAVEFVGSALESWACAVTFLHSTLSAVKVTYFASSLWWDWTTLLSYRTAYRIAFRG